MATDAGFLLLARKLMGPDSWLMGKPPLWMKLWVWMLGQANFKDRGRLKRGQFITSIKEMQEVTSHWVGFRKMTPSRDEIRAAYEAFAGRHESAHEGQAKPPMITTRKTTRGMIITICNYDKYQDFRTYEAHNEPPNEDTREPPATPHDTERMGTKRTKDKEEGKRIASIPYQEIVNLFHETCSSLSKIRVLGEQRKKILRARWNQYEGDMETFQEAFTKAESSAFLKGQNDRGWRADFDWMMKEANMAKVLEGKYDETSLSAHNNGLMAGRVVI